MSSKLFAHPKQYNVSLHCHVMCFVLLLLAPVIVAEQRERKTYIVYMGDPVEANASAESLHIDMLSQVLDSVPSHKIPEHLLYTYENFHGCVVKLTEDEAEIIAGMDGVVSIFENGKNHPSTTRSWDFMGFPVHVKRSNIESDIIVGVIDTGIWPESESFQDYGFGPPPSKWKGICQTSPHYNFTCNNKIVGARYFRADGNFTENNIPSSRDTTGHGTHVSSTVAGGVVKTASFLGLGRGTARGGVPSARIAVYKSCWSDGCSYADTLAAIDSAISDGVDILSISAGFPIKYQQYFNNPIAIGAFHAMKRGILTSTSAGNEGPNLGTIGNFAPWLLSVGASTMDRRFITTVLLGNGIVVQGTSLNTFDLRNKTFPLVYGGDAPDTTSNSSFSRFCLPGTLNATVIKGKIVVCHSRIGIEPFLDGAAGMISIDTRPDDNLEPLPLAASFVSANDGILIISYLRNSTSIPYGTILRSVQVNKDATAPRVASFSSRGPPPILPRILKPDLVAPGVAILAAWPTAALVAGVKGDERSVPFNMISGTSMACPHATAIAVYVKSFHPTWSEAAIRSALITTAFPMSSASNPEAELAYGAGHINPLKALHPGLLYDANESDYVKFLCSQGLNDTNLRVITKDLNSCKDHRSWDLNYPSLMFLTRSSSFDTMFTRTVTNVGLPNSTYNAILNVPKGLDLVIQVEPAVLTFTSLGEKFSFTVRVSGTFNMTSLMSASLVWSDGHHQVRSPIVVVKLS